MSSFILSFIFSFQPAVNLELALVGKDQGEKENLNFMLDLAAFDKLRFNVAKALNCTNTFKQN